MQGWTDSNSSAATNLPTQTEVSGWPVTFIRWWRGGSWNYHEATLQSAIRFFDEEDRGNDHFGFRIARTHSTLSNEEFIKIRFNLDPNPTKDHLTISMDNTNNQTTIKIYTITGQFVQSQRINSNSKTIKVDDLPKGLYLIKVGEIVKKLVIE